MGAMKKLAAMALALLVLGCAAQQDPSLDNAQPLVTGVVDDPPKTGPVLEGPIINPVLEGTPETLRKQGSKANAPAGKFLWPARGRIIAPFGTRPDRSHNDGINIALPQGSDIVAADAGRIAYAGSELKGYGNLVLIRHANGWVSAYAHADKILVRINDDVKRGQVIAKVGRSGNVDQPQLHFELRQGHRAVDPLPHLVN